MDLSSETDAKITLDYTADAMLQFYLQLGGWGGGLEIGDLEKSNMSEVIVKVKEGGEGRST